MLIRQWGRSSRTLSRRAWGLTASTALVFSLGGCPAAAPEGSGDSEPIQNVGDTSQAGTGSSDVGAGGTADSGADQADSSGKPADGNGAGGGLRFLTMQGGDLVELGTNPPSFTRIGGGNAGPMALEYAKDGRLLGISNTIVKESALFEVNVQTGQATKLHDLLDPEESDGLSVADAAVGPDGTVYVDIYSGGLLKVDLATGKTEPTAITFDILDAEVGAQGQVYARSKEHTLQTVDLATGAVTLTVGNKGALKLGGVTITYLNAMSQGADGYIYALARPSGLQISEIWRIDPATAATERIASFKAELTGLTIRR